MTPRRVLRWLVPGLFAAAVIVAIRQFGGHATVERDGLTFAGPALSDALNDQDSRDVRILSEFQAVCGVPCRAFTSGEVSGIACRELGGWHMRVTRDGVSLEDPAAVAATERALRAAATALSAQ